MGLLVKQTRSDGGILAQPSCSFANGGTLSQGLLLEPSEVQVREENQRIRQQILINSRQKVKVGSFQRCFLQNLHLNTCFCKKNLCCTHKQILPFIILPSVTLPLKKLKEKYMYSLQNIFCISIDTA